MLPIRPRRKQLRKRVVGQEEEEEEEEGKEEEQTPQRQEEKEDEDSAAVQRVEKRFNNRNKSRQQRREKKSSALSFGDEEEVIESVSRKKTPFQTPQDVKKKDSSTNSTRARKFMRAAKQPTTETATASSNERPSVIPASLLQRSQVGEYTPEKLAALRHNSNTFYFSSSVQPSRPSSHSSIAERSTTTATTTTMAMADAEKEEEKSGGEFLYDAVPIIPKKEEIERARAKRERMRTYGNILTTDEEAKEPREAGGNMRAEEEFIPLNSTRQDSKRVNQRLIRDSDSDSEEADGDDAVVFEDQAGNRIAFGDPKEMERRQKRLQRRSLYDEIERDRRREERQQKRASDEEEDEEEKEDSSEDEELERWELEQLKKGVRGKEVGSEAVELAMGAISMMDEEEGEDGVKMLMDEDGLFLQRPSSSNAAAAAALRHGLREGVGAATAQAQAQARATPTVQQIVEKLKQGLNAMQLNTSKHEKKLQQIEDTLKTSATTIDTTQQRMDFLSQQYVYYQELKEYVLDLLDCLKEKMPQISEYDVEMDKIRLEHYVERKKARQREIEETIEDVTKSKHSEERGSKKNVELDEFGRDKNAMEQTRKERRREMREKRRRERAERRPTRQQEQEDDGWTSEEDEDEEDYRQAMREYAVERDEILSLANGLFDDALPEFCSLLHIKRRFSYWLRNYSDDYLKSFAYISIADICAPLATLETLAWDPFFLARREKERKQEMENEEKPTTKEEAVWNSSFQRMNWYRLLEDYGKEEDAEIQQKEEEKEKDTMKKEEQEQQKVQGIHSSKDYALVSVLVRRVIVPKAKELFTHAWDPFFPSQTDFARTLLEQIMPHLRSDKEIKTICAPIVVTMQAAIQQVRVLPLLLEEDPSSPAYSLALSSFWRTLKLLKNIASFHKSLSNRALQALCLDKILNPELIPFLRKLETTLDNTHNPQTELLLVRMCERVMESFPSEWIHYNVGPTELLPSLLLYRELVRRLAKRFSTMEEARRDVLLQRLTNVLKQLGDDNDTAMKLE